MEYIDKKMKRQEMLKLRSELSPEEVKIMSEGIRDNLKNVLDSFEGQKVLILSFASYKNEPNTDILHGLSEYVAYPLVSDNKTDMEFYLVNSLSELVSGYKGIREPAAGEDKLIELSRVHEKYDKLVMIMPGLFFDKKGFRIGYGGGFYDRYYDRLINTSKIDILFVGICYDFQYDKDHLIKVDSFDRSCDMIITSGQTVYVEE